MEYFRNTVGIIWDDVQRLALLITIIIVALVLLGSPAYLALEVNQWWWSVYLGYFVGSYGVITLERVLIATEDDIYG